MPCKKYLQGHSSAAALWFIWSLYAYNQQLQGRRQPPGNSSHNCRAQWCSRCCDDSCRMRSMFTACTDHKRLFKYLQQDCCQLHSSVCQQQWAAAITAISTVEAALSVLHNILRGYLHFQVPRSRHGGSPRCSQPNQQQHKAIVLHQQQQQNYYGSWQHLWSCHDVSAEYAIRTSEPLTWCTNNIHLHWHTMTAAKACGAPHGKVVIHVGVFGLVDNNTWAGYGIIPWYNTVY